jgi:hypothetical protein
MACNNSDLQQLRALCLEEATVLDEARNLLTSPESWIGDLQERAVRMKSFGSLMTRLTKLHETSEAASSSRSGDSRIPDDLRQARLAKRNALKLAIDAIVQAIAQTEVSKSAVLRELGTTNQSRQMLSAYQQI